MQKEIIDAVVAINEVKEDSLMGLLYKDLAQPSIKAVGNALGSVVEFCTAPLLMIKFGSEVAKLNYNKHIANYAKKLEAIPEANRIPVDPQIGVPILEKLTSITNDEIADLFTTLLTKASSSDKVNEAHPTFIRIIGCLSVDEARILLSLTGNKTVIRFVTFLSRAEKTDGWGYPVDKKQLTLLAKEVSLLFPQSIPLYIDNLISLGILEQPYTFVPKQQDYPLLEFDKILEYHDYKSFVEYNKVEQFGAETKVQYGLIRTTALGTAFKNACISIN